MKTTSTILTLILFVSFLEVKSQNCSYKTNEVDKSSGKNMKITKSKMVADNPLVSALKISGQKNGDDCSINCLYDAGFGGKNMIVSKNAEFIITLEDGTEIKLLRGTEKDNYPISKGQINSLLKSKASMIQYYFTSAKTGEYKKEVYKISSGGADKIQDIMKCIN